jgi:alpha-L-rhamnosidase
MRHNLDQEASGTIIGRDRMRRLAGGVLGAAAIAAAFASSAQAGEVRPVDLTTERMEAPLGLGEREPQLAWQLRAHGRGSEQTAYRVVVHRARGGESWDSGVVPSSESGGIPYEGEPLRSRTAYEWRVKVWDERGRASDWSRDARFEMGLLEEEDWQARWIEGRAEALDLEGARWIWFPEGDPTSAAPAATRYLRTTFDLPAGAAVRAARMLLTADDEYELYVNGQRLHDTHDLRDRDTNAWQNGQLVDVAAALRPGSNTLAVAVANRNQDSGGPTPAGFIGRLRVELGAGDPITVDTGEGWRAADQAPAGWEQPGFDDSAWPAAMVLPAYGGGPWGRNVRTPSPPPPYLRREFELDGRVERARLYATALGVYEARINGERVGDLELAPGWTDYHGKVQYQAYDVTRLLRRGGNALAAVVGDGWFSGRLQGGQRYGDRPAFLAQLEVRYSDGRTDRIATDGSWEAGEGGLRAAGIYDGEVFDERLEPRGWDEDGFDGDWTPAVERTGDGPALVATAEPGMRVVDEVRPVAMTEPSPGTYVFDLGQNMVGWVRLRAEAAAGATVRLRHGEVLNPDGTLYTANLRSAQATEEITAAGGSVRYEPRFTYHGFRYVEVTGADEPPRLTGRVVSADTPRTGDFDTSNPTLDGLQHAIEWGQWGNFLAVPTDCPQRDERLGWTGDIQMFAETSTFNADVRNYLNKWLHDLDEAQRPDGAYPDVAPAVCCGAGTAGWGDAGTIVPWALYERYGDERVLAEHYEPMTRWIEYLQAHSTGLLRPNEGYGDWLATEDTPRDVIGTAFFARSTEIVADAAEVLGRDADAERFRALWRDVRDAFVAAYVTPEGRIKGDSQTAYVLALRFGLLDDTQRAAARERLVELIEARDWHLSTGFLGTPHLLPVLTDAGRLDVAYRLLEQETYPSWGYMIRSGATTVWERWDSLRTDGTFQDPGMNSFNHYGFGSVGDWMYRTVAGLEPDPEAPGWRRAIIRPRPGGTLTHASAELETTYGVVASGWRLRGDRLEVDAEVPANTRATVHVPADSAGDVRESGRPASRAPGVRFLRMEDGAAVFSVGSGSYEFEVVR